MMIYGNIFGRFSTWRQFQACSLDSLLTEVYRWPSPFMAMYNPVFTDWMATTLRPTGMRLNKAGKTTSGEQKKLHTSKKEKSPHRRATGANYKRYCCINQRAASHSPLVRRQACATQSESLMRRGKSAKIITSVASAPPRPAGATCKVVVIGAATGAWRISVVFAHTLGLVPK